MYYDITGLNPHPLHPTGGHGFIVVLYPQFREMVTASGWTQDHVNRALAAHGRMWLDGCGYGDRRRPDGEQLRLADWGPPDWLDLTEETKNYEPVYGCNSVRLVWGEWGLEHITVPGDRSGLDIDRYGASVGPPGGKVLLPHNIDCWRQAQLLLVIFTWFAHALTVNYLLRD